MNNKNSSKYSTENIGQFPVLSPEDEKALCVLYQQNKSQAIRNKLVEHNLRLVCMICNKFTGETPDLFAEGCLGLIAAIEHYDLDKNIRLATYARYWIKAYLYKYIMFSSRLVKIGKTCDERKLFFSLSKERSRLEAQGIVVSNDLLAKNLGVKATKINEMEQRLPEVSLNISVADEGKTLGDTISCDLPSPEDTVEGIQMQHVLVKEFSEFRTKLKPREQRVFDDRMLNGATLQDLANEFSITREGVRKIEIGITEKLKKHCIQRGLTP